MPIPPKGRADYLRLGDWNANCGGCARKFKASTLRLDWKGFYKCAACWEPRQPQDFVRGVPDMMGAPWVQQYASNETLAPPEFSFTYNGARTYRDRETFDGILNAT